MAGSIAKNVTQLNTFSRLMQFPLGAPADGKFHDFEEPHSHHYYIAASQFYKMLFNKPTLTKTQWRPILNQSDAIESVRYIVNSKALQTFTNMKRLFKEQGKVSQDRKVKELLLFHGTKKESLNSILENNFDLGLCVRMAHGDGIYMSEHPEVSFGYGDQLLLCRVSHLAPVTRVIFVRTGDSCSCLLPGSPGDGGEGGLAGRQLQ